MYAFFELCMRLVTFWAGISQRAVNKLLSSSIKMYHNI